MTGLCCVSSVPWREERGGWKKRETLSGVLQKVFSSSQCSSAKSFFSAFINMLFHIQGGNICHQFCFQLRSHIPCPTYFWKQKKQVVLIYGGFITTKECFQNACPLLTTPLQGVHASSACSVVLIKDYLLVFLIKSRVSWRMRKMKQRRGITLKITKK